MLICYKIQIHAIDVIHVGKLFHNSIIIINIYLDNNNQDKEDWPKYIIIQWQYLHNLMTVLHICNCFKF